MIFSPQSTTDMLLLKMALDLASKASRGEISPENFNSTVSEQFPELEQAWKYVRENKDDFYKTIPIIIALLAFILSIYTNSKPTAPVQIMLPQELINGIRSARDAGPENSQTDKSE